MSFCGYNIRLTLISFYLFWCFWCNEQCCFSTNCDSDAL